MLKRSDRRPRLRTIECPFRREEFPEYLRGEKCRSLCSTMAMSFQFAESRRNRVYDHFQDGYAMARTQAAP